MERNYKDDDSSTAWRQLYLLEMLLGFNPTLSIHVMEQMSEGMNNQYSLLLHYENTAKLVTNISDRAP